MTTFTDPYEVLLEKDARHDAWLSDLYAQFPAWRAVAASNPTDPEWQATTWLLYHFAPALLPRIACERDATCITDAIDAEQLNSTQLLGLRWALHLWNTANCEDLRIPTNIDDQAFEYWITALRLRKRLPAGMTA